MERALTCPVMLPRVISELRLAISQRRVSTRSRSRFRRCSPRPVGLLLDELLLHGGAVLEHVGADMGFGFGVGGGVGVEADRFGGMTVGHAASED